jgi:integrase
MKEMNSLQNNNVLPKDYSKPIPVNEAIRVIRHLPYASTVRVCFGMLFLTGCRINELKNFRMKNLYSLKNGYYKVYWSLGKNQTGYRSTIIPPRYIKELKEYRENNKHYSDLMFSAEPRSFARLFDRHRKHLGGDWYRKAPLFGGGTIKEEYLYQLKGLRKTFATWTFYRLYKKYRDYNISLEFTSRDLHHSTKNMTATHYIKNFEDLEINKLNDLLPEEAYQFAEEQYNLLAFI